MTASRTIQTYQISFNSTSDTTQDLGGVQGVIVRTSADVYIDFDQPTATSTSFKLLSANTADTTIDSFSGSINKIYARGSTGTGTLYIIALVK